MRAPYQERVRVVPSKVVEDNGSADGVRMHEKALSLALSENF